MKTKSKHTSGLLSKKTHPIIEIYFEFAQLENLYRQGWLKRGVSEADCETVAEHSFKVALLGYTLAEEYRPDLDSQKVMKLGLIHDLGEVYAGDTTPDDKISSEDKSQKEYAAVQKIFAHLTKPNKYVNLWLEYEKRETPEAEFVHQVDKLEMALQANLYEHRGYKKLDEFFPDAQGKISSPELKLILDDLLSSRKAK